MAWDVRYLEDKNIVFIVQTGPSTYQDYEEQTRKALELGKEHNTHLFLGDRSRATNTAEIMDIYQLPALYEELGSCRTNKYTLIVPESDNEKDEYRFFETTCNNREWNVKLFQDKQDAIEWLQTE